MKSTVFIAALASLLLVFGCGEDGSDAKGPTAPDPVPSKLAFGFTKGETLRFRTGMSSNADTQMGPMAMDVKEELTWNVREVADDGTATVDVTIDTVKAHMEIPMMGAMDYDSTVEAPAEGPQNPMLALFSGTVGKTYTMKLTSLGKVVEVTGYQELMDEAMKDNPMWGMIKAGFSNAAKAQSMEAFWCELPGKEFAKGDAWESSATMPLATLGKLSTSNKYRVTDVVEGPDGTVVSIAFETALDESSMDSGNSGPMSATLKGGNLKGALKFDPVRRRLISSRSEATATLDLMGAEVKADVVQEMELIK